MELLPVSILLLFIWLELGEIVKQLKIFNLKKQEPTDEDN